MVFRVLGNQLIFKVPIFIRRSSLFRKLSETKQKKIYIYYDASCVNFKQKCVENLIDFV